MARYLDSLGVDIEKPFEAMPLEPDENGYLEYCACQYVVFGSCPEDFTHRIGGVTFGRSDCHPNTKIDEEHCLCMDNDDAGRAACDRLGSPAARTGLAVCRDLPHNKDWNEDLQKLAEER